MHLYHVPTKVRGQLEAAGFQHWVGPWDGIRWFPFAMKCLYLLSHFIGHECLSKYSSFK